MARAKSIWVLKGASGNPIGTYTVKHELISFLLKAYPQDRRTWTVMKFPDGTLGGINVGTVEQFVAANG